MELKILGSGGIPENSLVSIRVGQTRRQANLGAGRPYRFGGITEKSQLKVDVYVPIAHARLLIEPGEATCSVPLDPPAEPPVFDEEGNEVEPAPSNMYVDFEVTPATGGDPGTDKEVEPQPQKKKQDVALDLQPYFEQHSLISVMQTLLQAVIKEKPLDPYGYMIKLLEKSSRATRGQRTRPQSAAAAFGATPPAQPPTRPARPQSAHPTRARVAAQPPPGEVQGLPCPSALDNDIPIYEDNAEVSDDVEAKLQNATALPVGSARNVIRNRATGDRLTPARPVANSRGRPSTEAQSEAEPLPTSSSAMQPVHDAAMATFRTPNPPQAAPSSHVVRAGIASGATPVLQAVAGPSDQLETFPTTDAQASLVSPPIAPPSEDFAHGASHHAESNSGAPMPLSPERALPETAAKDVPDIDDVHVRVDVRNSVCTAPLAHGNYVHCLEEGKQGQILEIVGTEALLKLPCGKEEWHALDKLQRVAAARAFDLVPGDHAANPGEGKVGRVLCRTTTDMLLKLSCGTEEWHAVEDLEVVIPAARAPIPSEHCTSASGGAAPANPSDVADVAASAYDMVPGDHAANRGQNKVGLVLKRTTTDICLKLSCGTEEWHAVEDLEVALPAAPMVPAPDENCVGASLEVSSAKALEPPAALDLDDAANPDECQDICKRTTSDLEKWYTEAELGPDQLREALADAEPQEAPFVAPSIEPLATELAVATPAAVPQIVAESTTPKPTKALELEQARRLIRDAFIEKAYNGEMERFLENWLEKEKPSAAVHETHTDSPDAEKQCTAQNVEPTSQQKLLGEIEQARVQIRESLIAKVENGEMEDLLSSCLAEVGKTPASTSIVEAAGAIEAPDDVTKAVTMEAHAIPELRRRLRSGLADAADRGTLSDLILKAQAMVEADAQLQSTPRADKNCEDPSPPPQECEEPTPPPQTALMPEVPATSPPSLPAPEALDGRDTAAASPPEMPAPEAPLAPTPAPESLEGLETSVVPDVASSRAESGALADAVVGTPQRGVRPSTVLDEVEQLRMETSSLKSRTGLLEDMVSKLLAENESLRSVVTTKLGL